MATLRRVYGGRAGGRFWVAALAGTALAAVCGPFFASRVHGQEAPRRGERRGEPRRSQPSDDDDDDRELPFDTDQLFVPRWRLTNGPQVWAAFRPVVERARTATVKVKCDGKVRGLGGIVSSDGWILTKATPLCGEVTCVLVDGRELPGINVTSNRLNDLALVKIEAIGLATLDLTDATVPAVGSWLATVGTERDPVAVGVVSVGPREIPPQPGRLGITLDETNEPVAVQVIPEGGAADAGMKDKDRILSVEGKETHTATELRKIVGSYNPGDIVTVVVQRGAETLTFQVTLLGSIPGMEERSDFQNNLGGRLSVRRFGFPLAIQHDSVLRPVDCGGPVVDLDGRVVGFNIARAGRTESYLIPTSSLHKVVGELMTTGLAELAKRREDQKEQVKKETSEPDAAGAAAPAANTSASSEAPAESAESAASASDKPVADAPVSEAPVAETSAAEAPAEGATADAPAAVGPAMAAAAYADEGYNLAWSDEFEANGRPDPTKWTYERGFVRNEELQWYRPDNARCEDGLLVIEGRKERIANPRYEEGGRGWQRSREFAEYTSASLLTRGMAEWQYGRFEMRGRIDVRKGLWPAWWTLGNGGWPACGEIDVMEYYRGMLLANAAWADQGRWKATWDDSRTPLAELGGEAWAREFHVWRMDWDEKHIALSVDGRVLNEVDLEKTLNAGTDENPFHTPHYMILNLAIGGQNGGDPGDTEFPAKFEVDWVRVYQK